MSTNDVLDRAATSLDRRKFFKQAGSAGLGVAALAMVDGSLTKLEAATVTDADILNFALNLEYLEAEFYLMSTWGTTLQGLGVLQPGDVSGPTTGGKMVDFRSVNFAFAASGLRTDEVAHVKLLRKALGSAAAKKPTINLDALGYGFGNIKDFFKLSRQFEDVGVSAYLGAAPAIQDKMYLLTAAEILATEAQHSGSVRLGCIWYGADSPAVDSLDIPPSNSHPYHVDSNGLSVPRTTSQVLKIVYGGGSGPGGFYPEGLNGTIK